MKHIRIVIISLALLLTAQQAHAQRDSVVYNESVVVTGEYNPVLDNTLLKLNVAPQITDTNMELQHDFSYSIVPRRLTSIFQPTRIKAAKIIGEPATRLYNNYFRIGVGNKWSGLLDAYYNSTRNVRLTYGANLHHYGSWGTLGHKPSSADVFPVNYWGANHFAATEMGGFAKYILQDDAELSTNLNLQSDYNLFYGFNDSTLHAVTGLTRDDISKKDYTSRYRLLEWTGGIKSLNTDVNQLGYNANILLGHLWGRPEMSEFHMRLDGTVHYGFPMFKQYKGIAALQLTWDHYGERYDLSAIALDNSLLPLGYTPAAATSAPMLADTNRWDKGIFTLHPYIDFLFRDFKFHVGTRGAVDQFSPNESYATGNPDTMDTHLTTGNFHLFPDIEVSKNFLNDAMNVSAGFAGDLEANSWNAIRLVNPYVAPNQETRATSHYDVYARMRFDFSKKLGMRLYAQYSWLNDVAGFCIDTAYALNNLYRTNYVNYSQLKIGGNFTFINDEMLHMEIGGNYYNYDDIKNSGDQSFRAYRPTWDAHLSAKVNYNNKVYVQLQSLLLSRMTCEYGTNANGLSVCDTLPMRYGISLNVEYIHTRAISFFLNVDNIACQRYFYWSNYPSRKLTVMAGMTYTIPTKKH